MKTELTKKKCSPCNKKTSPLKGVAITKLKRQLGDNWKVIRQHHLEKEYSFKDFKQALDFTNRVGTIAERENHHPDIVLTWGKSET